MVKLTLENLLGRINLNISFDKLGLNLCKDFKLGQFQAFAPLLVGYEEVNSLLATDKGKYIVKIFSKDKDYQTINSNVIALLEYYKGGVPVPKLYVYKDNEYLYRVNDTQTYLIVMDYFDGRKFAEIEPANEDYISITKILAKINGLNFRTSANYDMWITIHLPQEFEAKKNWLEGEDFNLIAPVVEEMNRIDFPKLGKSIVHFDLHRENVMKNDEGKYCILDLACTDYNYRIFDLGTFIALFCLDSGKSIAENKAVYRLVMETYNKENKLSAYELKILPIAVKAALASNLLVPEYLQKSGTDENPEQTIYYKKIGYGGLKMLKNIKL